MDTYNPFHGSGRAVFQHSVLVSGNNATTQKIGTAGAQYKHRRPRLASLGIFLSLLFMTACTNNRVPIPPVEKDKAPVISVNAVASGGSGQIQYPEAMPSSCASPCKNAVQLADENGTADVVLIINAKNPGGVKDLSVVVSQGGPLYTVTTSSAPDAQNRVPTSLAIIGTNNAGGIGSNPLLIHLNKTKTSATVVVEAGNYNGQRSLYAVTYFTQGHVQVHLSASKNVLYSDEQIQLTWTTSNAESIAITPALVNPPPSNQVNGAATVGPFSTGTHAYKLTARNWLEFATSSVTLSVNARPNVGGDLRLSLEFTCPNPGEQLFTNATFQGRCDANCTSSNPSNVGVFSLPYPGYAQCASGVASVTAVSPANLKSGSWKVKVIPQVASISLTDPSPECAVQVKAGEHPSVIFRYVRNPRTLRWAISCQAN